MYKGQVSLEFLIVLAASLAVLIAFFPFYNSFYHHVHGLTDYYNGRKVFSDLFNSIKKVNALGPGSYDTMDIAKVISLKIKCNGKELHVYVRGRKDKGYEDFNAILPVDCIANLDINKKTRIRVYNNGANVEIVKVK